MDAIPHGVTVLPAFRPARWGDAHAFPGSGCAGAGLSAAGVPGRARLLVTEHVAPVSRCCLGRLCVCVHVCHTQSCLTLCDPVDCGPPGSVHAISQTGIREWVALPFSRESSGPKD